MGRWIDQFTSGNTYTGGYKANRTPRWVVCQIVVDALKYSVSTLGDKNLVLT